VNAFELISAHEGLRLIPYHDPSDGSWTVGFGQHLDSLTIEQRARLSAPYGGDMTQVMSRGITLDDARQLLRERITRLEAWAGSYFPWFSKLSETRRAVLIDMAYELGEGRAGKSGLLGFPQFIAAIAKGDVAEAIKEMNGSRWAMQVPQRETNDAKLWAEG